MYVCNQVSIHVYFAAFQSNVHVYFQAFFMVVSSLEEDSMTKEALANVKQCAIIINEVLKAQHRDKYQPPRSLVF